MKQADSDGDGKISFLEFVNMMNRRLYRRCVDQIFCIDCHQSVFADQELLFVSCPGAN